MLASRVRLVLEYVKAVERGELEHNHEVMRLMMMKMIMNNDEMTRKMTMTMMR